MPSHLRAPLTLGGLVLTYAVYPPIAWSVMSMMFVYVFAQRFCPSVLRP